MKKICTLLLTAGMLLGAATGASAIDFKAKGQWIFGFGMSDVTWQDGAAGQSDTFSAMQRVRLQIDAVASEALSATVFFEIGDQNWGKQGQGAALGTDGVAVEVKRAYLDWYVPNTDLSFRMGLQAGITPNVAGGSGVLNDDVAGIVANYKINDMASVTLAWFRPYNDNYTGWAEEYYSTQPGYRGYTDDEHSRSNYLDNYDLFMLSIPLQGENWSVNPWFMLGFKGDNVNESLSAVNSSDAVYFTAVGLSPDPMLGSAPLFGGQYAATVASAAPSADWYNGERWNGDEDAYTTVWFVGLPMSFQYDAWNFELDLNYGYVQYSGTYTADNFASHYIDAQGQDQYLVGSRVDSKRSGWLIKGLIEYKMDWGTPGLFAWYGSGDDNDVKNGSEMMPFVNPYGTFTSFMGGEGLGWQPGLSYEQMTNYSGTWGIGLQVTDLSFMEDLSHVIRIAYWGGTNSSEMTDYIETPYLGNNGRGMYLTEDDYLVEINFDTKYQIYDNLSAHLQLGYIFNGIDHDNYRTWDGRDRLGDARDGYKATLTFNYSF